MSRKHMTMAENLAAMLHLLTASKLLSLDYCVTSARKLHTKNIITKKGRGN